MYLIYAWYNMYHNSIGITTFNGYILRIDCNKAEKGIKTTAWTDHVLNAMAIDNPLDIYHPSDTYEFLYLNNEIIKNNMLLEQAKEMLMLAKQELHSVQYAKITSTAVSLKNEVMEMIAKVRERKGRLDLPIVSRKHLRRISDRTALQSADNAEKFIATRKIDSFESLANFTADKEQRYQELETVHLSKGQKLNRLKELSKMYALFAPIQAMYKESQSLKGLAKMRYDKEHKDSLSKYPELKERMQSLLQNGEKITPKQWKAEIQSLQSEYDSIGKEQSKTAAELAYAEFISYNKKNLKRELQNESRQHSKQQSKISGGRKKFNVNFIVKISVFLYN